MVHALQGMLRAAIDVLRGRSPYRGAKSLLIAAARVLVWPFTYATWRMRCRFGPARTADGLPPITLILLSFSRPRNLAAQVDAALACSFISEVILSNNNPEIDLSRYVKRRHARLKIVQQRTPSSCVKRIELAAQLNREFCLCMDDDLYLWPSQLERLASALVNDPDRIHGITGANFDPGRRSRWSGFRNEEREVDVVSRVYAFTSAHAQRFFALIEALQAAEPALVQDPNLIEDVVLSFSGRERARIHRLGPHIPDVSSMDHRKAIHRREHFIRRRCRTYQLLREWRRNQPMNS